MDAKQAQQIPDEYAEYKKKQQGNYRQQTSSSQSTKKVRKENEEMGKTLKQALEESKGLTKKITLFNANAHGIKNNEDTTNRFMIMEDILDAYTGDEKAIKELNEILNTETPRRMSMAVRNCLEGSMSLEMLEQSLFVELHGIDHTELGDKQFSDEELVNFSIIKELCPTAEMCDFTKCTPAQLGVITKAAVQNRDLSDINLLTELCVLGNIEEVRKSKTMSAQSIKLGNLSAAKVVIYDFNEANEDIEIYEQTSSNSEKLLAVVNAQDKFTVGNMDIVKQVTAQSRNLLELDSKDMDELSRDINKKREITTREAREKPMSKAEKLLYEKEVAEAEEQAEARRRSYLNA